MNLIAFIHYTVGFLSITGGILFTVGSVVYWPTLTYINPNTGGILFIIGSTFYFVCDILSGIVDPAFTAFKPLNNIGSLRTFLSLLGNLSFIIGSVYFLPALPAIVGEDIFIIGSIFIWIPQVLTCWGLYTANSFTAQFFYTFGPFKSVIITMNVLLAIACMLFFVGSVLFKDEDSETIGLYSEGIAMFIGGSFLFFLASVLNLLNRRDRLKDPLFDYHDRIRMEMSGRASQYTRTIDS